MYYSAEGKSTCHIKMAAPPSALSKMTEYMNIHAFFISQVQLLDTRCLLLHSKVYPQRVCTPGFEFPQFQ